MATLLLQAAGQALGGLVGGAFGGVLGRAAGALAGRLVDQALVARLTPARRLEGPRLKELDVLSSSEGAPVPRLWGRARLAGQIIWATRFEEEVSVQTSRPGGKFGGPSATTTTYRYYANIAVALCEGPITRVGRIWADGKPLDVAGLDMRVHRGDEDQLPDPLIEAREGAGHAPAYRGLAYVVFERLPLENFGNRLPQLAFETFRAADGFEKRIRAVTVIPGATEFGYDTEPVMRGAGVGRTESENRHAGRAATDWSVALDDLDASCPEVASVALVVSWFGDDLRCGACAIRPGVEAADKVTTGRVWQVGGVARAAAHPVSRIDGRPAFGGTPNDASVLAAIADLKARGKKVVFYPFLMMDVPAGNGRPDPWGGAEQAAYPWRGRVTCHPAPGRAGSPDKTAAAAAQVAAFFGTAQPGDFAPAGDTVAYSGPAEWSLRRMVLHYARLCALAGGVDAFLIGSELVALTTVRDAADHYPAVDALVALAADVRAVLGAETKISYAADWSEYFGHQPTDGSGDVFFHLDPLWASADIDFVGIDSYTPLADWRDGDGHLDALAGAGSIYDLAYLRGNVAGGEGFDWYYASAADRAAQLRTPITDGAHGKPWVFRFKDLKSWWENPHFDRPAGVESATPTGWVPQSKPVWFTEAGCPAVDKGANQPNVFHDPKSSESALPHVSTGARDDLMQRRYIDAFLAHWSPDHPDHVAGANPVSAVYGGPMVDPARIHLWTWDARPFPYFPGLPAVWADGANWARGHWLTGRVGSVELGRLVAGILAAHGFSAHDTAGLRGIVDGYVIDRPMSAREALDPLSLAFFFDGAERDGRIVFAHRDRPGVAALTPDGLVDPGRDGPVRLTRAQEGELPVAATLGYVDALADYRVAAVESRRLVGLSRREARADLPLVSHRGQMQAIAEIWLQDVWTARETAEFALPPSRLALEPGDALTLVRPDGEGLYLIGEIEDGAAREARARAVVPALFRSSAADAPARAAVPAAAPVFGPAHLVFLDIAAVRPGEEPGRLAVAAFADPWPGALALYRSRDGETFDLVRRIEAPATTGETLTTLWPGPAGRWDRGNSVRVVLHGGALAPASDMEVLAGANLAAIRTPAGTWEILQFAAAGLVAPRTYELARLLRGQAGSEDALAAPVPPGAPFVLLDAAVARLALPADELGPPFVWRYGPAGHEPADPAFLETQAAFGGRGLVPFSPVHVRGRRAAGGDIALTWVRRTRTGGDAWEGVEVPLGEEAEAYEVDIFNAGAVVRTLAADAPALTYTLAMQTADFGAPPAVLDVAVCQLSATRGRGITTRATLHP